MTRFACALHLELPCRATIHTAALIQDLLPSTACTTRGGACAALARKVTSLAGAVHGIFSTGAAPNAFVFVQKQIFPHLTTGAVLGRAFTGPTAVQGAFQAFVASGRRIGAQRTGIRANSLPKEFFLQTTCASGALSIAGLAAQSGVTWHAEPILVGILPLAAAISPVFANTIIQNMSCFATCRAVGAGAKAFPATGIAGFANALSIELRLKLPVRAALTALAAGQKQWSFTGAARGRRGTAEAALWAWVTHPLPRVVLAHGAAVFASTIYENLGTFTSSAVGAIPYACGAWRFTALAHSSLISVPSGQTLCEAFSLVQHQARATAEAFLGTPAGFAVLWTKATPVGVALAVRKLPRRALGCT